MAINKDKLCVDCKHRIKEFGCDMCALTRSDTTSAVTGRVYTDYKLCSNARLPYHSCAKFQRKKTMWERIKGLFV